MKCKNCGTPLPKNVVFCDICGARQIPEHSNASEYAKQTKFNSSDIVRVAVILLVVLAVVAWAILSGNNDFKFKSDYIDIDNPFQGQDLYPYITPDQYREIKPGMTYEEVVELVGREGIMQSKYGDQVTYIWPGKYCELLSDDINQMPRIDNIAEVRFVDNKYFDKSERTLTCEEEAKAFKEMTDYSQLDTPVITRAQVEQVENDMDYEQVAEIFKGDGVLIHSWLTTYDNETVGWKTYVWQSTEKGRPSYYTVSFEDNRAYYPDEPNKYMD